MAGQERWAPIEGYGGAYQVSDRGRVMSRHSGEWRLLSLAVMKPVPYHRVTLCLLGEQKGLDVHGLVMAAFVGPRPKHLVTRHLNGNASDNRLENLAYGTHSENQLDTVRHGGNPNVNKTHCPQDHEYTTENTKWTGGWRHCRACERNRERERYYRKRDAARGAA